MAETTANGTAKAAKPRTSKAASAAAAGVSGAETVTDNVTAAKSRFSKAVEEARAGAEALRDEAVQRGAAYKDKLTGKISDKTGGLGEDAKAYGDQAKEKATALAREGKARASDALAAVGNTIAGTAATVDEKLGPQYGDYARSAARWTQEAAAKLEAKDLGELGDEVMDFVKKSPGAAIGIAAVAGFVVARMLSGGSSGSED